MIRQLNRTKFKIAGICEYKAHLKELYTKLDSFNGTRLDQIRDSINGTVDKIRDFFKGTVDKIRDSFKGTVDKIRDYFGVLSALYTKRIKNIMKY